MRVWFGYSELKWKSFVAPTLQQPKVDSKRGKILASSTDSKLTWFKEMHVLLMGGMGLTYGKG